MSSSHGQLQADIPSGPPPPNRAHPHLGINAKRGCTDCPCIVVLILFWGVMIFVAQLGLLHGNPDRLIRGTDYLGNVCGRQAPSVNVSDWSERVWLWYPITYDARERKLLLQEAFSLGICVKECPRMADFLITGYGSVNTSEAPPVWPILFDSKPQFYRCFPEFLTFECSNSSECIESLKSAGKQFAEGSKVGELLTRGFQELQDGWWIIVASCGIAVVVCFIWLFMLRRLVKPMVVLTAFLLLAALIVGGILCWWQKTELEAETPPQTESAEYWMAGAIVIWVTAFLYMCVMIFLWRDLMTACDIIEEASKVPVKIQTMALVPPFFLILAIPMFIFSCFVAIYVQSSGSTIEVSLPAPKFNVSDLQNRSAAVISGNTTIEENFEVRQYTFDNWRIYAHFYNLFMFLWTFGILNAIGYMTLAFCGVFWYWSVPGDAKDPPLGAVPKAVLLTVRYHLGTVAFGAFIVALIQLLRVILVFIERKMKEVGERTDAVKFLFRCLHCVLACLERIVKYINKNAYIMTAMTGESFFPAARRALDLLANNALSVGAVNVVGEFVMIFGKVLITAACVIIAWALMDHADATGGLTSGVLILCVVAVVTFFIATLFINIFETSIDTILLCYCFDKNEPGQDYYPEDLHKRILEQQLRSDAKSKKGASDAANQQMQQLLPDGGTKKKLGAKFEDL